MNLTLIGFAILLVAYAINRFVMTEATKKLADSDKLRIFDVFSRRNNFSTVLVLILVFLYFGALQYLPHFIIQITGVYLALFCAYLILRFASNYRKLKQMQMPSNYIKSFITSYCVFLLGFLGMSFCIFWNWTK